MWCIPWNKQIRLWQLKYAMIQQNCLLCNLFLKIGTENVLVKIPEGQCHNSEGRYYNTFHPFSVYTWNMVDLISPELYTWRSPNFTSYFAQLEADGLKIGCISLLGLLTAYKSASFPWPHVDLSSYHRLWCTST